MTSSCFTINYIVTPEPWDTPPLDSAQVIVEVARPRELGATSRTRVARWRCRAGAIIRYQRPRRSGHPGGWADWGAVGRAGGDTLGRAGRGADGRARRNALGWADRRADGRACRNTLGWAAGVLAGGPAGTPSGGPAGTPSGGPTGVLAGGPAGMLSGGPAGTLSGTPGVALAANTSVDVVSWHPERASACAAASSARGDGTTPALGSAGSAGVPAKTGGPVQPSSSGRCLALSSSGQLAARQMANANASTCRFAACSAFVSPSAT